MRIFFYGGLLGKKRFKKSNGPDEMQRTPCGGTTDSTDNPSQFQPSLRLRTKTTLSQSGNAATFVYDDD